MNLKLRPEAGVAFPARHQIGIAEAASLSREDGLPAALAISRMVELMELAAIRLMKPLLSAGQSSIAISMEVTYAAPIASRDPGGKVRAVASYLGKSGRLHRFNINAFDESGLIGSAQHARAVAIEPRVPAASMCDSAASAIVINV